MISQYNVFSNLSHKNDKISQRRFTTYFVHKCNILDERWRDMRITLSPAFTGSKMRHMMPFMMEISDNFIQYLEGKMLFDIFRTIVSRIVMML